MRLGKKILGLLAGIMCFGALASCSKGGSETTNTEEKATIETIYYCDSKVENEGTFSELAYTELSSKTFSDKYKYFTIAFKPNTDVVVKSITTTITGEADYTERKVPAYSNVLEKRTGDRAKLTDGGTRYECLGNSLSYSLNVTVTTDKYFEFVFFTPDAQSFSNVKITFEEVK